MERIYEVKLRMDGVRLEKDRSYTLEGLEIDYSENGRKSEVPPSPNATGRRFIELCKSMARLSGRYCILKGI